MNIFVTLFFYTVNNGLAVICQLSLKPCIHFMTQGTNGCTTPPADLLQHKRGHSNQQTEHALYQGQRLDRELGKLSEDTLEEALAPNAGCIAYPRSVHPAAYGALQAHPGLQSCILVSATLVYGYGQVDNHLKA